MVQRAVHNYYKFFDETLQSTTFIVLIITSLIFMVWSLSPAANANTDYLKGNIMQSKTAIKTENRVIIDGIEYKLEFIEVQ